MRQSSFPALQIRARVTRYASFYVINIIAPMVGFVLLTLVAFCHLPENHSNRLGVSMTMVLVAAAYKFSMTSMIPPLTYVTLLDRFVLGCSALIALIVVENGVLGAVCENGRLSKDDAVAVDVVFLGCFGVAFLALLAIL